MLKRYFHLLNQHGLVLSFGFAAVFWGNFGQSFFVGAFGESIQQSLGLSATDYGNAYSLATVASALTVTWLGGLIDRFKLRTYTLAVSLGLFAAMLLMSQVGQLVTLLVAFYLLRLFGQALLRTPALPPWPGPSKGVAGWRSALPPRVFRRERWYCHGWQ